jgi:hypothetical protein
MAKVLNLSLAIALFATIAAHLRFLSLALFPKSIMSHGQFIVAYETVPLGFLISTPETLRILLVYKIRETRFQVFLFSWACTLLAVLGAGICGFSLMPMFLAVGLVAEGVFLLFFILCIGSGDILLDFALEDERFFELATRCHALSIFEDMEFALYLDR